MSQKNAVIFGAGAIGLAFLGDLLDRAGYAMIFLDVREDIISALRARGYYEIHIVQRGEDRLRRICRVSAINSGAFATDPRVREAVCGALAEADFIITAAGERALVPIAPILAAGLARRYGLSEGRDGVVTACGGPCRSLQYSNPPIPLHSINIMCCENIADPAAVLRDGIQRHLPEAAWCALEPRLGIARSVISRMTPVVTSLEHIVTEPYDEIPVEAAAWKGPPPDIQGLRLVENFPAYKVRKLIMHNMTHATAAYLGYFLGKRDVGEAMQDARIVAVTRRTMKEAMEALIAEFGLPRAEQEAHGEDLIRRYDNPALGHAVANVARDPIRKLSPGDRMVTAARLAEKHGLPRGAIMFGMALALNYDHPADAEAQELQRRLAAEGLPAVLKSVCGVAPTEPLASRLSDEYEAARRAIAASRQAGNPQPTEDLVDALVRKWT